MKRPKVLIVDDREENIYSLTEVLSILDIDIISANSGKQALTRIEAHEFAVILLDVQMPEIDGFATAKLIKEKNIDAPPIIFITARNTSDSHINMGYAAGAVDYLLRPLDANHIRAKVSIFLQIFNQKIKLEESNSKLSSFANMICHDGKKPLRALLYEIKYLEEKLKGSQLECNQHLTKMHSFVKRMQTFYDDLELFSSTTGQKKALQNYDLNEILNYVLEDLKPDIKEKEATINISKLVSLKTSATEFGIIIQNLISNAIKFVDRDKKPVVNITGAVLSNNTYELKIIDNGVGIDQSNFEHIFEPFKRLQPYSRFKGTGLGLSSSKKLAEYLGGSLKVEASSSNGTSFILSLPYI